MSYAHTSLAPDTTTELYQPELLHAPGKNAKDDLGEPEEKQKEAEAIEYPVPSRRERVVAAQEPNVDKGNYLHHVLPPFAPEYRVSEPDAWFLEKVPHRLPFALDKPFGKLFDAE